MTGVNDNSIKTKGQPDADLNIQDELKLLKKKYRKLLLLIEEQTEKFKELEDRFSELDNQVDDLEDLKRTYEEFDPLDRITVIEEKLGLDINYEQ